LFNLNLKFPAFEYTALVRNSHSGAKVAAEYPKIRLVYGGLDDSEILEAESAKADIVIRKDFKLPNLIITGNVTDTLHRRYCRFF
jgi:hypothetical protein